MSPKMTTLDLAAGALGISVSELIAEFTLVGSPLYVSSEDVIAAFQKRLEPEVFAVAPRNPAPSEIPVEATPRRSPRDQAPSEIPVGVPHRRGRVRAKPARAIAVDDVSALELFMPLVREVGALDPEGVVTTLKVQRYYPKGTHPTQGTYCTKEDAARIRAYFRPVSADSYRISDLKGYNSNTAGRLRNHGIKCWRHWVPGRSGRSMFIKNSDVARAEAILAS